MIQQLPSLDGIDHIYGDTESSGLRWYGTDFMTGFSICLPNGETYYLPIRHAGGNLPEERVKDWARQELRNKKIDFFYAPYDINVFRAWGIDLEAQGCTFGDPGHRAALLDDQRRRSGLDAISKEYLGYGKKPCPQIDRMAHVHASEIEEYARWDVKLLRDLDIKLAPMIEAEGLLRVQQLEEECIPATAEMMWNGAHLNEELLDQWLSQSERDYAQALSDLQKDLGAMPRAQLGLWEGAGQGINPKSQADLRWIFDRCGLPYPTKDMPNSPDFGKVTFEKRYLEKIDHPTIRKLRRVNRLASFRSKYLIPYKEELKKWGRLLYSLNQLRAGDEDAEDVGTKYGRYSSSAFQKTGDGVNIQQVAGKKYDNSVKEEVDWPYHIRLLFEPEDRTWRSCSADADQIEYRWFAHYAQPKAVMEAYAKDPKTNFHRITHELIRPYKDITYELTKDCNFAGLYLAGAPKFSWMIGIPYQEGKVLYRAYHDAVPEVQIFGKKCMRVAEDRGYVKTFLGRRARFPKGAGNLHAAPNRVIQGSAGDEMKTKIVALRRAKTGMKLRFTVHDEVYGDVPNQECAEEVSRVLNTQILETRVPLLWTVKTGPNWQECKK